MNYAGPSWYQIVADVNGGKTEETCASVATLMRKPASWPPCFSICREEVSDVPKFEDCRRRDRGS